MYAGRAVECAPTRKLFARVRMPYTRALLEAIPRVERPPHSALPVVPGRPPDLVALPPGCPFAPRCPNARDRCREAAPPFAEHEPEPLVGVLVPVRGLPMSARPLASPHERQRGVARGPRRRAGVRGARRGRRRRPGSSTPCRASRSTSRRGDARRGGRDGLGQVDARAGACSRRRRRRPARCVLAGPELVGLRGRSLLERAALGADGLPGSVRLAGPALAGVGHRRGAAGRLRDRHAAERRQRVREVLDRVVWTPTPMAGGGPRAAVGRPGPAGGDRPRAGARPGTDRLRRGRLLARRADPGAGAEPVRAAAGRPRLRTCSSRTTSRWSSRSPTAWR